jgi:hypothetical protein
MERLVETNRCDCCAGDRRQQSATQGVAERVAEAGLKRTDSKLLPVVRLFAEGFNGGALHDEHLVPGLSTALF